MIRFNVSAELAGRDYMNYPELDFDIPVDLSDDQWTPGKDEEKRIKIMEANRIEGGLVVLEPGEVVVKASDASLTDEEILDIALNFGKEIDSIIYKYVGDLTPCRTEIAIKDAIAALRKKLGV